MNLNSDPNMARVIIGLHSPLYVPLSPSHGDCPPSCRRSPLDSTSRTRSKPVSVIASDRLRPLRTVYCSRPTSRHSMGSGVHRWARVCMHCIRARPTARLFAALPVPRPHPRRIASSPSVVRSDDAATLDPWPVMRRMLECPISLPTRAPCLQSDLARVLSPLSRSQPPDRRARHTRHESRQHIQCMPSCRADQSPIGSASTCHARPPAQLMPHEGAFDE